MISLQAYVILLVLFVSSFSAMVHFDYFPFEDKPVNCVETPSKEVKQ